MKKYKNKPFAILGVNSDKDRQEVKKVAKQERLTWRSWWNDGSTGGHIADEWSVTGWPTLYLIDHARVIRYKTVGAGDLKKLDQEVARLVKDANTELAKHPIDKTTETGTRAANVATAVRPDSEHAAASKLKLARILAESGKTDKARERYQEIIRKFPMTEAAGEAKELLSQLPK